MYSGVVKFNPLTDPDRTGTEYYDFFFASAKHFVLSLVSRVVVRCRCFELGCARINHFVNRTKSMFLTEAFYAGLRSMTTGRLPVRAELCNGTICKPEALSFVQCFVRQCRFSNNLSLELYQMLNFIQEPPVNLSQIMNLLQFIAAAECFGDQEQSLIIRFCQTFVQCLSINFFRTFQVQAVCADFQ
ncbi:hypothetical protein D3C76_680600 [compost metagenome]